MRTVASLLVIACGFVSFEMAVASAQGPPGDVRSDYNRDVAPLLTKFCAGCHNDGDRDGEFSLESYASLMQGIEDRPAVLPGDPDGSRMIRVLTGAEPAMPPEGEPAPSEEEIELLKRWIEQGAAGPEGEEPDRLTIRVPAITPRTETAPITALAASPDGKTLAVARFGEVTLLRPDQTANSQLPTAEDQQPTANSEDITRLTGFPGKVTAAQFVRDGTRFLTASGVAGSGGIATLWNVETGERIRDFKGHRDLLYDAEISPDGTILATCSYDRRIILWDVETGEQLRSIEVHNGAVYDLAFSPDGSVLASASADDTCKLWRVSDGTRLDTLGQPLKEQYSVTFSPDGRFIAAGGADNRIRIWRFVSKDRPRINPLVHARFAHEGPIVRLAYTPDGEKLISVAEDRTIKVWETKQYTELKLIRDDVDVSMTLAVAADSEQFFIGRMDGSLEQFRIPSASGGRQSPDASPSDLERSEPVSKPRPAAETATIAEQEPNDSPAQAQPVTVPAKITGVIHNEEARPDEDFFRFSAQGGEEWVIEVDAARSGSPLDSVVEVLTTDGQPIERVLLQAVRDSYFTFRGKNADQSNDFRIFNWEEMELNEYLYCNGEVVKLWLYPRGPDSGFNVYPGTGTRWAWFDTTPLAHALGEPCYIVRPHPPGSELIPNGLPVFPIYYENDDDSRREFGSDSKLFFTAPENGEYLVRLRDVRGMEGKGFKYTLLIRPPQPDFSVNLADKKFNVSPGSAGEIRFTAKRMDQFDGPIDVTVEGLPAGYAVTSPITIQAEQISAEGVIMAAPDAPELDAEALKNVIITAAGRLNDGSNGGQESAEQEIVRTVKGFEEFKLVAEPKLTVRIVPAEEGARPVESDEGPLAFEIRPGETIMLKLIVERHDFQEVIPFGTEGAGRNLPHGVYVDNIGLNGLLLLEDQDEREFFITAAPWVPEQTRLFHLRTTSGGGAASHPVMLHIRSPDADLAGSD